MSKTAFGGDGSSTKNQPNRRRKNYWFSKGLESTIPRTIFVVFDFRVRNLVPNHFHGDVSANGKLVVWDPRMKRIVVLEPRIPDHKAPNHQFTISIH